MHQKAGRLRAGHSHRDNIRPFTPHWLLSSFLLRRKKGKRGTRVWRTGFDRFMVSHLPGYIPELTAENPGDPWVRHDAQSRAIINEHQMHLEEQPPLSGRSRVKSWVGSICRTHSPQTGPFNTDRGRGKVGQQLSTKDMSLPAVSLRNK